MQHTVLYILTIHFPLTMADGNRNLVRGTKKRELSKVAPSNTTLVALITSAVYVFACLFKSRGQTERRKPKHSHMQAASSVSLRISSASSSPSPVGIA